jgi:acetolactate synthase-1/2/3 large subunit
VALHVRGLSLTRSAPLARPQAEIARVGSRAHWLNMASPAAALARTHPGGFVSRYADDEPRKGADILVEALEREGVDVTFGYPGGASLEIHQALTRAPRIRNILCRHEQGEIFAAEGFAKSSGRIGVCIATSGPGATNLVTGLADAMMDSVPLVAITGQVPRRFIGTDAFQETPIVEISRQITKHNYLIMNVEDIPRVVREAFFLASSGRPGPVLIDVPKDVQQQMAVPEWTPRLGLAGYLSRLPGLPHAAALAAVAAKLREAKRPVIYAGGGCLNASAELREFVALTKIPVAQTLMGLGVFPETDPLALGMLGMHGTFYANAAVDGADLLLAFGVRFDDRVTGKLEAFATHASIVHVDVDPAEINKNKTAHVPICGDVKTVLTGLNALLRESGDPARLNFADWRAELDGKRVTHPMSFHKSDTFIVPQAAISMLREMTPPDAIVATGVGQHQMWAAQWFPFDVPYRWLSSGGLGSMGFGLPAALGAAAANPGVTVIDIDGDGSFVMNIQELATIAVEKLPVKIVILNNQHLGMVVQWEDRFYKANRAHTYLGMPEADYAVSGDETDIYPDFVTIAKGFGVRSARVTRVSQLREAFAAMLAHDGPYLLDVMVPHQEHVLPMIPGGGSFKDTIMDGDGRMNPATGKPWKE